MSTLRADNLCQKSVEEPGFIMLDLWPISKQIAINYLLNVSPYGKCDHLRGKLEILFKTVCGFPVNRCDPFPVVSVICTELGLSLSNLQCKHE